jgi:hypothetical protein
VIVTFPFRGIVGLDNTTETVNALTTFAFINKIETKSNQIWTVLRIVIVVGHLF